MKARFTDSIASTEGWSYGYGQEVLVTGDRHTADAVPESVGRVWLTTGLLEPVGKARELATAVSASVATTNPTSAPLRTRSASRR